MTNLNQRDLLLTHRHTGTLTSQRESVDLSRENRDLATATRRENLAQAIINRLYTRKGELAALGHPDYGSRLYQLVGEINNNRTRALAELYIRECLTQEPRIAEILEIVFQPPNRDLDRNSLKCQITVQPVEMDTPLTLNLSLTGG
jgi:phage baseplate assembly protein W